MSYIFLDVWSKPKGPPLQGHDAIKHSQMKRLIGGDKGGREGSKGSNRGCSQASRMKARVKPKRGGGGLRALNARGLFWVLGMGV